MKTQRRIDPWHRHTERRGVCSTNGCDKPCDFVIITKRGACSWWVWLCEEHAKARARKHGLVMPQKPVREK